MDKLRQSACNENFKSILTYLPGFRSILKIQSQVELRSVSISSGRTAFPVFRIESGSRGFVVIKRRIAQVQRFVRGFQSSSRCFTEIFRAFVGFRRRFHVKGRPTRSVEGTVDVVRILSSERQFLRYYNGSR